MLLKACIKSAKERISSDFVGGYSLTNTAPPCGAGGKGRFAAEGSPQPMGEIPRSATVDGGRGRVIWASGTAALSPLPSRAGGLCSVRGVWTRPCSMHCGTRREPRPFTAAGRVCSLRGEAPDTGGGWVYWVVSYFSPWHFVSYCVLYSY